MKRNDLWTRRLVLQRGMQLGAMGVEAPLAINLAAAPLKPGNVAARCRCQALALGLIRPHVLGDQIRML